MCGSRCGTALASGDRVGMGRSLRPRTGGSVEIILPVAPDSVLGARIGEERPPQHGDGQNDEGDGCRILHARHSA